MTDRALLSAQVDLAVGLEQFLQSDVGRAFQIRAEEERNRKLEEYAEWGPKDPEAERKWLKFQAADLAQQYMADLISEGEAANNILKQMDYTED